jgi:hypothetical protein
MIRFLSMSVAVGGKPRTAAEDAHTLIVFTEPESK